MKQGHLPEPCGSRNEACSRSGAHLGGLSDGRSRSRRTPEAFARASRAPPRSQRPGTVAATGSSNARCSVRRDGGQTHAPHLSRASKLVGECMRMSPDESRSTVIRIGSPKKRWNISAVCGSAGSNSLAGTGIIGPPAPQCRCWHQRAGDGRPRARARSPGGTLAWGLARGGRGPPLGRCQLDESRDAPAQ
jgi:hypothetical protein